MSIQRLLVISLVANLVCLGGLIWSLTKVQSPSQSLQMASPPEPRQNHAPEALVTERVVREAEPLHRSQIESDDTRRTSRTCEASAVRGDDSRSREADLDKFYDQRKAEVLNSAPSRKDYWKTGHPTTLSQPSAGTRSQLAQLDQEKNGVLNELFGAKGVAAINRPSAYSRRSPRPRAATRWILSRRKPRRS